ncbi:glutathione S-transferase U8-like [Pistacia vera]|uniref:glutathione S-transferase U8-like n=1 Tax=Pistacia vera TaxID=55513 RepID=UPI0012639191|nr:glutathione S-transferase U8-like [Pistacia vera]
MGEVKLLGAWGSPFSRRIEIALKLKGVEYEYIEQDLGNKSALLLQYNPVHKLIPVLVHKGKPIAESDVILEYIDETWKNNPILPEDPYERAMARFWVKFIDEKCVRSLWKACWVPENIRKEAVEEAYGHLKTLENDLKINKFFWRREIGVVDIVANFIGFWVGCIKEASGVEILTEEKFPKLHKWSGGVC